MQNVPTSSKICASVTLENLKSQIQPSTPYLHVHFNVSQTRLAVIVSKIVKRVVSYIIFTIHARNVHLQRELKSQMSTNWDDASKTSERCKSRCSLNVRLATAPASTCLRDANISSIWCKDDVTYCTFDVVGNNNCQSFCSYSMIH